MYSDTFCQFSIKRKFSDVWRPCTRLPNFEAALACELGTRLERALVWVGGQPIVLEVWPNGTQVFEEELGPGWVWVDLRYQRGGDQFQGGRALRQPGGVLVQPGGVLVQPGGVQRRGDLFQLSLVLDQGPTHWGPWVSLRQAKVPNYLQDGALVVEVKLKGEREVEVVGKLKELAEEKVLACLTRGTAVELLVAGERFR